MSALVTLGRPSGSVVPEADLVDETRRQAALSAEACQVEAISVASEITLKGFGYEAIPDAAAKCRRDMGFVYRHCVAAMVYDDESILVEKLLSWLAPVLHSRNFPGGAISIQAGYNVLRQETMARVDENTQRLLGPYFDKALQILSEHGQ